MEVLLRRRKVDLLARAAAISVGDRMQRLMDVADEVDEKGEVAGCAPFVVIPVAKPAGVLVDFRLDAIPLRTPRRHVAIAILQANVDKVPGRRGPIFLAEAI